MQSWNSKNNSFFLPLASPCLTVKSSSCKLCFARLTVAFFHLSPANQGCPSSTKQAFLDLKNVHSGCSAAIIYSSLQKKKQIGIKILSGFVQRTHSYQWKQGEKKRGHSPAVNIPVIPQSQQCFNLLCHLMYHLNVPRRSNMNHEYMHPGVGQHSLLEYITSVSGDHFVHPSKMYHISTVQRERHDFMCLVM